MRRKLRWILIALGALLALLAIGIVANSRSDIPLETLKAHWATGSSRFIHVDGMDVHYRDEGTGPAIVLLHGTSSSLHTWDGWARELAKDHRVLRMDLPAFGLTGPSPKGDYTHEAYAEFVEHFVARVGAAQFVLAGNSLGGAIAWKYALSHPERVRALVLVDSGGYPLFGGGRPVAFRVARWPLLPHVLTRLDPRRLVEDGVKKAYGDPTRLRRDVLERYYELSLRPGNRQAFVRRMQTDNPDDSARIRGLRAPTLILWGARDQLLPVEAARRFHADIAGSRLIVYPELGHVPMEENPDRSVADVRRFISELPTLEAARAPATAAP
jgi:pimeloyl-ACP methyl ester carboxylesterase